MGLQSLAVVIDPLKERKEFRMVICGFAAYIYADGNVSYQLQESLHWRLQATQLCYKSFEISQSRCFAILGHPPCSNKAGL